MANRKDGPYGGPGKADGVPGHVIAAVVIVILVITALVLRFVFFFDWDDYSGRLLTDMGHIKGPERALEDGINDWLFDLYGWDDTDVDQRAQPIRPEQSGIAGDGRYSKPVDPDDWDELTS